jgi:hypothetical protein
MNQTEYDMHMRLSLVAEAKGELETALFQLREAMDCVPTLEALPTLKCHRERLEGELRRQKVHPVILWLRNNFGMVR